MIGTRAATSALLLILAGCVSGPDHVAPTMPLPVKFSEGANKANQDPSDNNWWAVFADSELDTFVASGLGQNVSILNAVEATRAAEGAVVLAGAGGLPGLTLAADNTTSGQLGHLRARAGSESATGATVTASWLLDMFGQYRRAREGALDQLDAAYSTIEITRLAYLQDLVTSYINARYYQTRTAIVQENLKSRRATLDLTKFQLSAGAASRLDVVQAEGLVNSALSEVPALEIAYQRTINHIASLLTAPAASVHAQMGRGGKQPVFRGHVTAGVPADLIRNRPDIRRAERNLAAATAQIGVAEAQLYPSISLSGAISPSYIRTAGAHGGLTSWSFGPTLNLPILDGGALKANVEIAQSNARLSYLAWKATVLTGIEEVENALAAVNRDAEYVSALRARVRSYQEAVTLSTASYKDGASSLLDVLDAQRSVTDAQENLAAAVQQSANDYVALNVAIGAGARFGAVSGPPPADLKIVVGTKKDGV